MANASYNLARQARKAGKLNAGHSTVTIEGPKDMPPVIDKTEPKKDDLPKPPGANPLYPGRDFTGRLMRPLIKT